MMLRFSALILAFVFLELAVNTQERNVLPKSGECGQLKEDYLHNAEEITKFDEYPWIAELLFQNIKTNRTIARCGAVLISKRHLLAPAQCLMLKIANVEPTTIALGGKSTTKDPESKIYEIDEIAMHPNYKEEMDSHFSAIAVIRLTSEVIFGDTIQPICLPTADANNTDFVAQYLEFSGYERSSGLKKKTALHVKCMKGCKERLISDNLNLSNDYNMCTACNNRFRSLTGSPLMGANVEKSEPQSLFLIGLYLARAGNCSGTSPDMFLKVYPFLDWIKYNMV